MRVKNKINFYENGAIYIREIKEFLKNPKFLTRQSSLYLMSKKTSLDIDTYKDLNHKN